jgi:hypothetical protein
MYTRRHLAVSSQHTTLILWSFLRHWDRKQCIPRMVLFRHMGQRWTVRQLIVMSYRYMDRLSKCIQGLTLTFLFLGIARVYLELDDSVA